MNELEQQVEKLIGEFEEWFTSPREGTDLRNEPIVRSEKAIMKTFLWWLINLRDGVALPGVVVPVREKNNAQADVRDQVQPVRTDGDAVGVAGGPDESRA